MENPFVLLLYIIFALILAVLVFVLKKKHSKFPDFRVGYHNQKIMASKEKWEYANKLAGNLCALFAIVDITICVIQYLIRANLYTAIIVFFAYSITTILVLLIVPVKLSKK